MQAILPLGDSLLFPHQSCDAPRLVQRLARMLRHAPSAIACRADHQTPRDRSPRRWWRRESARPLGGAGPRTTRHSTPRSPSMNSTQEGLSLSFMTASAGGRCRAIILAANPINTGRVPRLSRGLTGKFWIQSEAFATSRLRMMRIVARRINLATVVA